MGMPHNSMLLLEFIGGEFAMIFVGIACIFLMASLGQRSLLILSQGSFIFGFSLMTLGFALTTPGALRYLFLAIFAIETVMTFCLFGLFVVVLRAKPEAFEGKTTYLAKLITFCRTPIPRRRGPRWADVAFRRFGGFTCTLLCTQTVVTGLCFLAMQRALDLRHVQFIGSLTIDERRQYFAVMGHSDFSGTLSTILLTCLLYIPLVLGAIGILWWIWGPSVSDWWQSLTIQPERENVVIYPKNVPIRIMCVWGFASLMIWGLGIEFALGMRHFKAADNLFFPLILAHALLFAIYVVGSSHFLKVLERNGRSGSLPSGLPKPSPQL